MLVSMKILLAAILVLAFCVESLDIDKDLLLSKPYSWFLEKITLEGEYVRNPIFLILVVFTSVREFNITVICLTVLFKILRPNSNELAWILDTQLDRQLSLKNRREIS